MFELWGEKRTASWRRDIASVNKVFFDKVWLLSFYDLMRSQMITMVVEKLLKAKIAILALSTHTSVCQQPPDVLVFEPMKCYTAKDLQQTEDR